MPTTNVTFSEIKSFTPAIDIRTVESGDLFVVDGKNFNFTSKGVASAFGATILENPHVSDASNPAQTISVGSLNMVATRTEIVLRAYDRDTESAYWKVVGTFPETPVTIPGRHKWTSAYVGGKSYVCYPGIGMRQIQDEQAVVFDGLGLPEDPLGIIENNGRLIVLDSFVIAWTAPFDGTDFEPSLAGGGFQAIAELVPGQPIAITPFEQGFYVWTTEGVIAVDYIGGEAVFRFDTITTQLLLLDGSAWAQLADGSTVFLTTLGLLKSSPSGSFEEITPLFNEFLRKRFTSIPELVVHLSYVIQEDVLYVQIMDGTGFFNHTYLLHMKLDKWGIFSEGHFGICVFETEPYTLGYINMYGDAMQFTNNGYVSAYGVTQGLDSYVDLGYIKMPTQRESSSDMLEIQQLMILTQDKLPQNIEVIYLDTMEPNHFRNFWWPLAYYARDLNYGALTDAAIDYNDDDIFGVTIDYNLPGVEVDFNASIELAVDTDFNDPGPDRDYNDSVAPGYDVAAYDMIHSTEYYDTDSIYSGLDRYLYGLEIESSFDGRTPDPIYSPTLAVQGAGADAWTGFVANVFHLVRPKAIQPGEKYLISAISATVTYAGKTI